MKQRLPAKETWRRENQQENLHRPSAKEMSRGQEQGSSATNKHYETSNQI